MVAWAPGLRIACGCGAEEGGEHHSTAVLSESRVLYGLHQHLASPFWMLDQTKPTM